MERKFMWYLWILKVNKIKGRKKKDTNKIKGNFGKKN